MMTFVTGEAFFPGKFRVEFDKTAIGVRNNVPEVLQYLDIESAKDVDQEIVPNADKLIAVPVGRRLFSHWLHPWAAKQTFAMWNEQTGDIISINQRVIVQWIPNPVDVGEDFLGVIKEMMTNEFHLSQGRVSYGDQFFYKYVISEDRELGAFFLILHDVTGILCYVMDEGRARELRQPKYGQIFETSPSSGIVRTL